MSNIVNHPDFIPTMLEYAVRSPRWMENVSAALKLEAFDEDTERGYQLYWAIASDFWRAHRRVIPQTLFLTELRTRIQGDPELLDDEAAVALGIAESAYEKSDSEFVADYMTTHAQTFINERIVRPELELAAQESSENMREALLRATRTMASARTSTGERVSGIHSGQLSCDDAEELVPTGLTWFDSALGGGLAPSVGGIMGPSNSGKTVFAIQLCETAARTYTGNDTAVLFGYENPIAPNYILRLFNYLLGTGQPMPRRYADWPQEAKETIDARAALYGNRLQMVDMVGRAGEDTGGGGIPELAAKLRELRDQGLNPKLVVIDQHQPMAEKYLALHGKKTDDLRTVMKQQVLDAMSYLAKDQGITAVFLHQWAPDIAGKASYWVKPKLQEAAECKSWLSWMDWGFGIGNPDANGVRWLAHVKSRTSALNDRIVRMNGALHRFECPEGRYEFRNRRFVDTQEDAAPVNVREAARSAAQARPAAAPAPRRVL